MSTANSQSELLRRIEDQRRGTQEALNNLIANINSVSRIGQDLIAEHEKLKERVKTLEDGVDDEKRKKSDTAKWKDWDRAKEVRESGVP